MVQNRNGMDGSKYQPVEGHGNTGEQFRWSGRTKILDERRAEKYQSGAG